MHKDAALWLSADQQAEWLAFKKQVRTHERWGARVPWGGLWLLL